MAEGSTAAPPRGGDAPGARALSLPGKLVFSLGDNTVSLAFSTLSLVFFFFLTEVAGLRPALAGSVVLLARIIDAVTDPLMGRITDRTRTRFGRRRPWFLAGAVPLGVLFAALWWTPPAGQWGMFAYYSAVYAGLSIAMTTLSVPYMALIPEIAPGYDERTSLNTWRSAASLLGTIMAVGMEPATRALGGDAAAFATVGGALAIWLVIPWLGVFGVSFERVPQSVPAGPGLAAGVAHALRQPSYRRLSQFYILSRIAMDIAAATLIHFFTYCLLRREDFAPALGGMLVVSILSLPFWLWLAHGRDKHRVFIFGAAWWLVISLVLSGATPEWPRFLVLALAASIGIGYAVADLIPWAMVGETIDEDELATGERREGLYNGLFTFVRKAGGGAAVWAAGLILDVAGYVPNAPQSDGALLAIRLVAAGGPALCLAGAIWLARDYPLDRARHEEISVALAARRGISPDGGA